MCQNSYQGMNIADFLLIYLEIELDNGVKFYYSI